jgi:hypothetical protein
MSMPSPGFGVGIETEMPRDDGSIASLKRSVMEACDATIESGVVGPPDDSVAPTNRGRTVSTMKPDPVVKVVMYATASAFP